MQLFSKCLTVGHFLLQHDSWVFKRLQNVEPKVCVVERSFYAFDVQSKSAWNHQRIAMTGAGQISVWSKHSRPMAFERKLKLSTLRFSHLLNRINARMLRWMHMLSRASTPPNHHLSASLIKRVGTLPICMPWNCFRKHFHHFFSGLPNIVQNEKMLTENIIYLLYCR